METSSFGAVDVCVTQWIYEFIVFQCTEALKEGDFEKIHKKYHMFNGLFGEICPDTRGNDLRTNILEILLGTLNIQDQQSRDSDDEDGDDDDLGASEKLLETFMDLENCLHRLADDVKQTDHWMEALEHLTAFQIAWMSEKLIMHQNEPAFKKKLQSRQGELCNKFKSSCKVKKLVDTAVSLCNSKSKDKTKYSTLYGMTSPVEKLTSLILHLASQLTAPTLSEFATVSLLIDENSNLKQNGSEDIFPEVVFRESETKSLEASVNRKRAGKNANQRETSPCTEEEMSCSEFTVPSGEHPSRDNKNQSSVIENNRKQSSSAKHSEPSPVDEQRKATRASRRNGNHPSGAENEKKRSSSSERDRSPAEVEHRGSPRGSHRNQLSRTELQRKRSLSPENSESSPVPDHRKSSRPSRRKPSSRTEKQREGSSSSDRDSISPVIDKIDLPRASKRNPAPPTGNKRHESSPTKRDNRSSAVDEQSRSSTSHKRNLNRFAVVAERMDLSTSRKRSESPSPSSRERSRSPLIDKETNVPSTSRNIPNSPQKRKRGRPVQSRQQDSPSPSDFSDSEDEEEESRIRKVYREKTHPIYRPLSHGGRLELPALSRKPPSHSAVKIGKWHEQEEYDFIKATIQIGEGNWKRVQKKCRNPRSTIQLKDKWRHISLSSILKVAKQEKLTYKGAKLRK